MSTNDTNSSNRTLYGVLAYIPPLFLIGFLTSKNDEFIMFHVNQGLTLTLAAFVIGIASGIISAIPIIGFIGYITGSLIGLATTVLAIMGIINVVNNQMKELPVIGQIRLIK